MGNTMHLPGTLEQKYEHLVYFYSLTTLHNHNGPTTATADTVLISMLQLSPGGM